MLIIHPLLVQSHLHASSPCKTARILWHSFQHFCSEYDALEYILCKMRKKMRRKKLRMRTNPQIKTEVANTSPNWIYLSILHVSSTIKINVNANFRILSLIWSFNLVQSIVFAMRNFLNFICIAVAFILK